MHRGASEGAEQLKCVHPGTEWPQRATDTTVVILYNLR